MKIAVCCINFSYCMNRFLTEGDMIILPNVTVLQVEDSGYCPPTCQAFHCLFISGALSYEALVVRNFRPDYGRCGPLGIHCTLRGNHLYSTPEVTEEHEIGKQLKHHSACEALGTEKSSCFRERVCGTFLSNFLLFFSIFFPPLEMVSPTISLKKKKKKKLCSIKRSGILG